MEQPFSPPPPPGRSWVNRNWKWALPVGCLTALLLCGGAVAIFFFLIYGTVSRVITSSEPYAEGMARARANPEVVAALGEPIESGFWVGGGIEVSGSTEKAGISVPISGPKGSGTLHVLGTKMAGQWSYPTMAVDIDGRPGQIDLPPRGP